MSLSILILTVLADGKVDSVNNAALASECTEVYVVNIMGFSHTVKTTASADDIWQLWTDVEGWPAWDSELIHAELAGPFSLGATGRLVPQRGAPSSFVISQLSNSEQSKQRSYTLTVQLPLCKLHVKRFFPCPDAALSDAPSNAPSNAPNADLYFTHEVSFEGVTAVLFRVLLGRQFRRVLPEVMQSLRRLAESR